MNQWLGHWTVKCCWRAPKRAKHYSQFKVFAPFDHPATLVKVTQLHFTLIIINLSKHSCHTQVDQLRLAQLFHEIMENETHLWDFHLYFQFSLIWVLNKYDSTLIEWLTKIDSPSALYCWLYGFCWIDKWQEASLKSFIKKHKTRMVIGVTWSMNILLARIKLPGRNCGGHRIPRHRLYSSEVPRLFMRTALDQPLFG